MPARYKSEKSFEQFPSPLSSARSTSSPKNVSGPQMALVDLYVQGAQCVIVSKDLSVLRPESLGSDTGPMTKIGRQMVW